MTSPDTAHRPVIDWLTVVAIASIAVSLNVAFHEGVHALTCLAVGGRLEAYSSLYADCESATVAQRKIVAGSAPTVNLLAGTLLWLVLRRSNSQKSEMQYFIWLLMLMNWFYGACYPVFSGFSNIGDWAVVIEGWEPSWAWRFLIAAAGFLLYLLLIRVVFQEFGRLVGGDEGEQYGRASKVWLISYVTSFVVILVAGLFCPDGFLSLPVMAGAAAALGALSPLLWMRRWFPATGFAQTNSEPLEIRRRWGWLGAAVVAVLLYTAVLGQTLSF